MKKPIQENLSKTEDVKPEKLYTTLYPPRKKEEAIKIEPAGIKPIEIKTENIDLNKQ